MKRYLSLSVLLSFLMTGLLAAQELKVEPAFWWSGMKNPELQLMVYGKEIAAYRPSIDYPGVRISSAVTLESPNYVLLYLDVADAAPGKFDIRFTQGRKKLTYTYELKQRRDGTEDIRGYDASDVLYLIMPDRFANGDPSNDQIPMRTEYQVDRQKPNARHGGDIAGIEQHLDYIQDLGVTAIWLNPVLENDMRGGSYHGYATTDYFRVDPRFGTNEDYVRLIDDCHRRGMRVVMDMIFNHCGSDHPWLKDVPSRDWFNNLDQYVQTNHAKEIYFDPYASDYDTQTMLGGWFVRTMPDLNQKNPHVAKYLIQNSIWWIEYSRVDGIRQDTYPYADLEMMTEWCREVMNEYPQYNIVGEAWMNYTIGSAYWQTGSKLNFGPDTELKSVMDFQLMNIASQRFHEETNWSDGLAKIYEHMCYDYVYPDIYNVLRFLENHDTERFLPEMPTDLSAFKQAHAFLLTIPGTPQLYYGQELLMNGKKNGSDGNIRKDVPGGWPGDAVNHFEASGRSAIQNEAWNFLQKLLKWRQGNEVIARGKMKHFQVNNGVYVYERSLDGKSFVVMMNGNSKAIDLPLDRYAEVLPATSGKDVITGRTVALDKTVQLGPKEVIIISF
ncbi:glycoside hydrolase family 13 protein [Parabacteroides sp. PF5-6]|uniref:glycoside hydrolase family 13 protein n=1 Tax=Parabacteroides sp. PF5-6 TaxID=1742403 RepID=UPI002404DFB2|nr:glycoside hydrolase family 13 protein [Parabacteroides sp. PF5-6]MDF9830883.1 glycosidase [Parabacteroides sp. PF5-6]